MYHIEIFLSAIFRGTFNHYIINLWIFCFYDDFVKWSYCVFLSNYEMNWHINLQKWGGGVVWSLSL